MVDSGEFPSSHSATVSALAMAVGLHEHFSSSLFAVSLVLAAIVIYDAANVRYYSGQNARVTQKLISDIQELLDTQLDDPVYAIKLKTVLGHKWFEIIGGILIGIAVALFFHFVL